MSSASDQNPQGEPPGAPSLPGLLAHLQQKEQQSAAGRSGQQLLLSSSPRSVCQELGLNWWAAVKLFEDGWLSFSPEEVTHLDESQEAELVFIGSLVAAGCDRRMLVSLLSGLSKPFAYDLRKIYYDWTARDWRIFPDPHAHPEALYTDWLEMLVKRNDAAALKGILELAQDALHRVHAQSPEGDLYRR